MSDSTGGGGFAPQAGGTQQVAPVTGAPPPLVTTQQQDVAPPPVMPGASPPVALNTPPAQAAPVVAAPPQQQVAPPPSGAQGASVTANIPMPGAGLPLAPLGTGYGAAKREEQAINKDYQVVSQAQQDAVRESDEAIKAQTQVDLAKQNAEQTLKERQIADDQRLAQQQADQQKAYNDSLHQQNDALNKTFGEVNGQAFDPNRFLKNRSVGSSLLSALAIGLGSIGQHLNGGSNPGQDMLNRAIDGDVEQQKIQYSRGVDKFNEQKSAFARFRELGYNEIQATQAARVSAWKSADQMISVIGGKYKAPEVVAKQQALLAASHAKQVEEMKGLTQAMHSQALSAAGQAQQVTQFAANRSDEAFKRSSTMAELAIKDKAEENKRAAGAGAGFEGWSGATGNKEEHKEAAKTLAAADSVNRLIKQARSYRANEASGGTLNPFSDTTQKGKSLYQQLVIEAKNIGQLGVLSAGDEQIIKGILGPALDSKFSTDAQVNAALDQFQEWANARRNETMRAYGFHQAGDDPESRQMVPRPIPGGK